MACAICKDAKTRDTLHLLKEGSTLAGWQLFHVKGGHCGCVDVMKNDGIKFFCLPLCYCIFYHDS